MSNSILFDDVKHLYAAGDATILYCDPEGDCSCDCNRDQEATIDDYLNDADYFVGAMPLLHPLPSMTEEDARELVQLVMNAGMDAESLISLEEISIGEMNPDDGGNNMDADIAIVIVFSLRCYCGTLCVTKSGGIILYNEDEEERISNTALVVALFCRKGFDLFGLIESGEALDATKIGGGE